MMTKLTVIIIMGYHCYQLHTKFRRISSSQGLYIVEIIGDQRCGFRRNRSTTDQIFCIRQILEKKWEHNETVHQLFIDFKKTYHSVKKAELLNILIEFGDNNETSQIH
jgi:hypothetical protein